MIKLIRNLFDILVKIINTKIRKLLKYYFINYSKFVVFTFTSLNDFIHTKKLNTKLLLNYDVIFSVLKSVILNRNENILVIFFLSKHKLKVIISINFVQILNICLCLFNALYIKNKIK